MAEKLDVTPQEPAEEIGGDTPAQPEEPATSEKVPVDSEMRGMWGLRPSDTVARGNECLENLVKILEDRGVVVDRGAAIAVRGHRERTRHPHPIAFGRRHQGALRDAVLGGERCCPPR